MDEGTTTAERAVQIVLFAALLLVVALVWAIKALKEDRRTASAVREMT